ncbi:MAG: topoisomerase C-terminal repeat-containing protein [Nannocystaceae bacterium]|nr:topoisomerase C-terminal repeat-containing protein [Nannocystaceae bacterium]
MAEVEAFTRSLVGASNSRVLDSDKLGPCPRCNAPVIEGKRGFGCSRWQTGCRYVLWKTFEGTEITAAIARELLQHRMLAKPIQVGGTAKQLCLTAAGTVRALALPAKGSQGGGAQRPTSDSRGGAAKRGPAGKRGAPDTGGVSLGACPTCEKPVIDKPKSYSCSGWREGCSFVIWKTISGKKISPAMATKLLKTGRTQVLKGFVSKAKKKFDARLRVLEGKVGFEF